MDWKQSYNDTKIELQMMQLREFELRKRWEAAYKYMEEGKMPSSVYCHIPLDKGLEVLDKAAAEHNAAVEETQRLEAIIAQMELYMNQFTNIENVIKYKRLQGMSYKQIAVDTGYSEGYLRNKMVKSDKRMTHNTNVS